MEQHSPQRDEDLQTSKDQAAHAKQRQSGLCADTIVYTMDGELPAGDIAPGDRIITRDAGMVILRGVRRKRITIDTVHIKAGSLGHNRPEDDLIVPIGTKLLIRDWRAQALYASKEKMVPAEDLIDGEYVTLSAPKEHDIIELIFDDPHVLYAGGMEIGCQTLDG
ncbi:Hint domain-containing protein [Planktotalea sp.]|uniref:Hint domain-containing protein n=1 Tax=Planktotalea sp. TaxID=2029877 RepID=UPI0032978494